jgi:nucleoid-associated protein YgaU
MSSPVAFAAAAPPAQQENAPPASLKKAYLELRKPPSGGGTAKPGERYDQIEFDFNPKELSFSKAAKWKRSPQRNAKKSGVPEFQGADPAKLQLEMFFDATDTMGDKVVKAVEKLFGCVVPTDQTLGDKRGSPPWVVLRWGVLNSFTAIVTGVTAKFTLFTPGGLPVRAICTVDLEEIAGAEPRQNPTSGAPATHDVHLVVTGDTLAGIAYRAYGDPALWRPLARANAVDDPMRLRPGTRLLLPSREELSHGQ